MSLVLYNTNYSAPGYVVPDWGTCTDEELTTALQKHYAGEIDLHNHWKIEDEIVRPLTLSTEESIELVLMHPTYPLADGSTAAFAVGMKDCLNSAQRMGLSPTNAGGWNGCVMRTGLNSTIYNQIPKCFRQNLKLMNVWTANGGNQSGTVGVYSQDYLALPAEREVFGSNTWADPTIESQLTQFQWYVSGNRTKKVNGSNDWWWQRSPDLNYNYCFCAVDSDGGTGSNTAFYPHGVSFFCAI